MEYVIIGIFTGSTYAIMAIGFVLIYSVLRIYPFQHGALVLFCSYAFLWLYEQNSNLILSLLLTFLFGILVSVFLEITIFGPLRSHHFASLMAGIGLQLIFVAVASTYFYFGDSVSYPDAVRLSGGITILGIDIDYNRLMVFGAAVLTAIAFDFFFRRTRPGMQMRAISDDEGGAELCGVATRHSIRWAFAAAGLSAAIAGILIGIRQTSISPQLANPLTMKGLAAVLVAGSTNLRGTVVCAVGIGLVESLAIGYGWAKYSDAIAYIAIILALCIRPQGIFGEVTEARA